ncbi:hypothetical protein PIROE2DRAFT_59164 [Piromyces sp. E2]|nr:hypothetical protein PIROE2DRAFT_59164 [Piromyces sp. E2]|eukprot:OUM66817.1 hypothetical protein PIROE2DRAFT_59164 [Piromyces sp. E2]
MKESNIKYLTNISDYNYKSTNVNGWTQKQVFICRFNNKVTLSHINIKIFNKVNITNNSHMMCALLKIPAGGKPGFFKNGEGDEELYTGNNLEVVGFEVSSVSEVTKMYIGNLDIEPQAELHLLLASSSQLLPGYFAFTCKSESVNN